MYKQELAEITRHIINSKTIVEEIESAKLLSIFFKQFVFNDHHSLVKHNETVTEGGIALSSFDAALCVDDYLRTARFIKGVFQAVNELYTRFPGQKINILYAGCGPYATLLLPLLPLFDKNDLEAILLDINTSSISSVRNLLSNIGLMDYEVRANQADAITYKKPDSWPIHLLISETMYYALIREPQVAIASNLVPQMLPNGILIPEEININLAYTFHVKEPYLKSDIDITEAVFSGEAYINRYHVDQLFSINKKSDLIFNDTIGFESRLYELPHKFDNYPDVCILTEIKIFNNLELKTGDSYITNPYCILSLPNFTAYKSFKLIYPFGETPKWIYQLEG
ncbi:hypothetical protein [Flavobacterium sp. '19STA2R22 D10 B1']|uniref:hypothetical protein n=1 Tax=Flavobacterium aerium TaxID=3037261 RepID=UPI00278BB70E|nr:hypothetical protein [Flavobacterium sp. '19STA2R22 D10 B1']